MSNPIANKILVSIVKAPRRISIDPRACARKYLRAASDELCHLDENIIGMYASIFSSRAIHNITQWEAEIAIIVLDIRSVENSIINGKEDIKKERN